MNSFPDHKRNLKRGNLVHVFEDMGNPFQEDSGESLTSETQRRKRMMMFLKQLEIL